ncbi:putative ribonuclease H protein, partial [Trifolium medium]|nr:putative ribonuclease H protein [Trifolium medium]
MELSLADFWCCDAADYFVCGDHDYVTWFRIMLGEGVSACRSCFFDSLQTVTLVKDGVSPYHLISLQMKLLAFDSFWIEEWVVTVDHTLREGNACVDILAKKGANSISSLVMLETPHTELSNLLLADAWG